MTTTTSIHGVQGLSFMAEDRTKTDSCHAHGFMRLTVTTSEGKYEIDLYCLPDDFAAAVEGLRETVR